MSTRKRCDQQLPRIAVLQVGHVGQTLSLLIICESLGKAFPEMNCAVVQHAMEIPETAYDPERCQYNSTSILSVITDMAEEYEADYILGVVDADIYKPGFEFIFGEACNPGNAALISLYRLKQEISGLSMGKKIFFDRAIKEAIHEVGHATGLKHCKNQLCVMFFSHSISDTDRKRKEFCSTCSRVRLNLLLRKRVCPM